MRCSHCEVLLGDYLDGSLSTLVWTRVERHLNECASCAAFLRELRAIDGLLITAPRVEPAANFTFAVMAEVRSVPAPAAPRSRALTFVAIYVLGSWLAAAAWIAGGRPSAHAAQALLIALAHSLHAAVASLSAASHALGRYPEAIFFVFGALAALDAVAAILVVLVYTSIRPRLVAQLSRSSEPAS